MTFCKLHIFDKDYDDNKKSDKNNLDNNNLKNDIDFTFTQSGVC